MAHNFLVCLRDGVDDEEVLVRHHVIPRAIGGGDEPDNLIILCRNCHWKIHRLPFYRSIRTQVQSLRKEGGKEISPADLVVDVSSEPTFRQELMEEANDLHQGIEALGKDFREFGREMEARHEREREQDRRILQMDGGR